MVGEASFPHKNYGVKSHDFVINLVTSASLVSFNQVDVM
jgi:hypothetical protein